MTASQLAFDHSIITFDEDIHLFERIALGLEQRGVVVIPNGLPLGIQELLLKQLNDLHSGEFIRAAVGRGDEQQIASDVRRNKISWIDFSEPSYKLWADWVNDLRSYLNKRLFLGLFSFESHFAKYHAGDYYQKHFDAFKGDSNRVLSLVTYLNEDWHDDWGGELAIYDETNDNLLKKVCPALGTLVIFLSEDFPHEVLPATHTRYSVAGWFSVNRSNANKVDPPQ